MKLKIFIFFFFLFLIFASDVSADVVINEFLVEPNPEWVEFHNASSSAEYLKSYWIDDDVNFGSDSGNSNIKQLTNINTNSLSYPYIEFNSFLNNTGDYVVLFDSGGNIVDQYQYASSPGSGVSIGRSPDGTGGFTVLASVTKGSANSGPQTTSTPESDPTSESTPSPSLTPTQAPTSTPKPTKKPTSKPKVIEEESDENGEDFILGLREELETDAPSSESEGKKKFPIFAGLFIVGGLGAIGFAGYSFIKNKRKKYNSVDDNNEQGNRPESL